MFGNSILVAPVLYENAKQRQVYLPVGEDWVNVFSGEQLKGGQTVEINTPIDQIPLFVRDSAADLLKNVFKAVGGK